MRNFTSVKKSLAMLGIGATIAVGGITAPALSISAAPSVSVQSVQAAGIDATLVSSSAAPSTATEAAGGAIAEESVATNIISWILKYTGVALSTLKTIVGKGWSYFSAWWNALSSWVRWVISTGLGIGVQEIYNQLHHYFYGW